MKTRAQPQGLPATLIASNWIGGREAPAREATYERRNPANRDDLVTLAPQSSRGEVRQACEKARAAQKSWARVPAPRRAQVLMRLAELLVRDKEQLSRFISREMGKPLREARGSVQEAIDTAEFFQSEGRRLYGQTVPSELPNKELFTYRRPIGVVGVITAGNFPIAVPSWKIVPALVCETPSCGSRRTTRRASRRSWSTCGGARGCPKACSASCTAAAPARPENS